MNKEIQNKLIERLSDLSNDELDYLFDSVTRNSAKFCRAMMVVIANSRKS